MGSSKPFDSGFSLDTSNFDSAAALCTKLAEKMRDLKQDLDNTETDLVNNWAGAGRRTFQKKYHFLTQQLGDLKDELYEMADKIYTAEEAYIQTDMDTAKALDGVSGPAD